MHVLEVFNIQRDTYNIVMPVNLTFPSWPEKYVVSSLMLLPGRFIASLIFFLPLLALVYA